LRPGTVFRWDNFPYPKFGSEIKARWFIYLGDSGPFSSPILAHLCTSTTKIQDFQAGGKRASHRHLIIQSLNTPFEVECLIDFDEGLHSYPKKDLTGNTKIQIKGELDAKFLGSIYNGLFLSRFISFRVLMDIHTSLNNVGITGLKKPKRPKIHF
jgi:hypothetical protein